MRAVETRHALERMLIRTCPTTDVDRDFGRWLSACSSACFCPRNTSPAEEEGGTQTFIPSRDREGYYPPPESKGGWRIIRDKNRVKNLAGMDVDKLDFHFKSQEYHYGGAQWSAVIIRHGYVAREFYSFNIPIPTRFNIWSGTKSFTGTAWGLLLDSSRQ